MGLEVDLAVARVLVDGRLAHPRLLRFSSKDPEHKRKVAPPRSAG